MRPQTGISQKFLYNEATILELYQRNWHRAKLLLSKLEVFCGNECKVGGLSGWVFEQTVQFCLQKELEDRGIRVELQEQVSLGGRAKADFGVGNLAIEIKSKGLFSKEDTETLPPLQEGSGEEGIEIPLFDVGGVVYLPYRRGIIAALGANAVFFLDTPGDWRRFVTRIAREVKGLQRK